MIRNKILATAACAASLLGSALPARAIIVINGNNSATGRNESAPTGALAGSGWDLQGNYSNFSGTPISRDWYITARHISGPSLFFNDGPNGTVIEHRNSQTVEIPNTDLRLHKVRIPFTRWATLYDPDKDGPIFTNSQLVMFGRGPQKGAERTGGWNWGATDSVRSWGTNTPDSLANGGSLGTLLLTDFDNGQEASQGVVSAGDSGGGTFVFVNNKWRLVGVNYGVDQFYTSDTLDTKIDAALFDARGYYEGKDSNGSGKIEEGELFLVAGTNPVPQRSFISYIPASLSTIQSTVPEPVGVGAIMLAATTLLTRRRRIS